MKVDLRQAMPLPMPFQISGRYQTINHPGQYISVSVYNVQYNNSTQTETVFRHNLYLICLGKIQSHLADAVIVIYEGRLQYLIMCMCVRWGGGTRECLYEAGS